MNILLDILFFIAFPYWIYFLYTSGKDERGKKISSYTAVLGVGILVLGIIVIDTYSDYNQVSVDDMKLWLNMTYRLTIIAIATASFFLNRYARL
ncbi:hypothetical protein [Ornithinibacillus halophilus]|uniref:Uncharacterized protein n=1 Tax=Ornithinibacillus halophilus TaxID=930117 RepID=A0A1M5M1T2_9BACI|nr:hypothetical protein [Ornithinibacillus halophilus]SHG71215.1 hypothetical protein SAMN05216225_10538 [Ornithinibacillus halophilus]